MKHVATTLCAALGATVMVPVSGAAEPDAAQVRATLEKTLKETEISGVRAAPIEGLWEVVAGGNVLYAEPGGRYLVVGSIYDLHTSKDLTAERRAEVNRIAWESLPLDAAVVRGEGSRKVAVFADPDCPFCRRLYHSLAEVEDLTVYEIMYPLKSLHPQARQKAVGILCSDRPGKALAAAYHKQRSAPKGTDSAACRKRSEAALDRSLAFGKRHGIRGTPMLIRADGHRHSGFMPPGRIEAWLAEADIAD